MAEFIKWGLLGVAIVALIALIVALPFMEFLNLGELSSQLGILATELGGFLGGARALINVFLPPFGRTILSGMLAYIMLKWVFLIGIKTTSWAYHFVFK